MPAYIRPGLRMPLGSNCSFSRRDSAASAAGCGSNTGTAARTGRRADQRCVTAAMAGPRRDDSAPASGCRQGCEPDQPALPVVERFAPPLHAQRQHHRRPSDRRHRDPPDGRSASPSAKGMHRGCRARARDARPSIVDRLARASHQLLERDLRCGNRRGANPSTRSSVALAADMRRRAQSRSDPRGRCAAPDTSARDPMASAMAPPLSSSVEAAHQQRRLGLGGGSTLKVTSVTTASVPQEPAISLDRS